MIQRIQTLYLLLAAGLMCAMSFMPLAHFTAGAEEYRLKAFGIESVEHELVGVEMRSGDPHQLIKSETVSQGWVASTVYMGIIVVVTAVLPFVAIFLYRRRWVQMRLCVAEMILLVGVELFVCFYLVRGFRSVAQVEAHNGYFTFAVAIPVVCFILTYLAFRGVMKDELLVKSLDRIR